MLYVLMQGVLEFAQNLVQFGRFRRGRGLRTQGPKAVMQAAGSHEGRCPVAEMMGTLSQSVSLFDTVHAVFSVPRRGIRRLILRSENLSLKDSRFQAASRSMICWIEVSAFSGSKPVFVPLLHWTVLGSLCQFRIQFRPYQHREPDPVWPHISAMLASRGPYVS